MQDRKSERTAIGLAVDTGSREFEKLLGTGIGDAAASNPRAFNGVVVGTLVGFHDNGAIPLVTFPGQPGVAPLKARTTVDLHAPHIGSDAVLMFEAGDTARPILLGCVRQPSAKPLSDVAGGVDVEADGERLVVSASQGLVLRCGKASITLSPDGKIVVRGTQVVSHATGLNRIRGGSVQVN